MPITELRIEGLRTVERARLALGGLTVLIGENGSGKSTILEACEILRRATTEHFLDEFYGIHGGVSALLRQGAPHLRLGVTLRAGDSADSGRVRDPSLWRGIEAIHYDLTLLPSNAFVSLRQALSVELSSDPRHSSHISYLKKAAKKRPRRARGRATSENQLVTLIESRDDELVFLPDGPDPFTSEPCNNRIPIVAQVDGVPGDVEKDAAFAVRSFLRRIQVHLPFETTPSWAARALDRKSALRSPSLFAPANRLEKLGLNTANAFHALKNQFGHAEWERTLDYVRLGLGERVEDVTTWADPGGGNIGLAIKQKGMDRPILASQLSDGMLAYLAFVALFRLHVEQPSLIALDEPDLHLHPRLLMRVLDLAEIAAKEHPVLIATHSDRLLDGLSDPAHSAVLCELDEHDATHLLRPDAARLSRWLTRYRGLGELRGAGHEASVFIRGEGSE